ncbi:uncharacterized protein MAM_02433 [Metarhizium album ARSEF 1941]|uniref:Uncharacterized protein n=1 Tax=Metarhizium album (strain ARSEF 1941) TaxID=1081103 RepID=A0A0B2X2S3_METAS|nr:uncharacterized protein MAM_02433 [Metarhizium album ARSEF 1941]KHN99580.1 hypothetical protein MAM_02433 [Metarhizium album ARSEF 1941]
MKGLALVAAAAFAAQAFAGPAPSQQEKRADGDGDAAQRAQNSVYVVWGSTCKHLGMSHAYCEAHVTKECEGIFSDAYSKARENRLTRADFNRFKNEVETCFKLRDPATEAGLCHGLDLSEESCKKYARECRQEKQAKLDPSKGTTQGIVTSMVRRCLKDKAKEQPPTPAAESAGEPVEQPSSGPGADKPAQQDRGDCVSESDQQLCRGLFPLDKCVDLIGPCKRWARRQSGPNGESRGCRQTARACLEDGMKATMEQSDIVFPEF